MEGRPELPPASGGPSTVDGWIWVECAADDRKDEPWEWQFIPDSSPAKSDRSRSVGIFDTVVGGSNMSLSKQDAQSAAFWKAWASEFAENAPIPDWLEEGVRMDDDKATAESSTPFRSLSHDELIARSLVQELQKKGPPGLLNAKIFARQKENAQRLVTLEEQLRMANSSIERYKNQLSAFSEKKKNVESELAEVRKGLAVVTPHPQQNAVKAGPLQRSMKVAGARGAPAAKDLVTVWATLRGPQLYLFNSVTDRLAKTIVCLDGAIVRDGSEKNRFDFSIILPDLTTLKFFAESESDYESWMRVLRSTVDERAPLIERRDGVQRELFRTQELLVLMAKREKSKIAESLVSMEGGSGEQFRAAQRKQVQKLGSILGQRMERAQLVKQSLLRDGGGDIFSRAFEGVSQEELMRLDSDDLEAKRDGLERKLGVLSEEFFKGKLKFPKDVYILEQSDVIERTEGKDYVAKDHRKKVLELQIKKITGSLVGITKAHASQVRTRRAFRASIEETKFQKNCLEKYQQLEPHLRLEGDEDRAGLGTDKSIGGGPSLALPSPKGFDGESGDQRLSSGPHTDPSMLQPHRQGTRIGKSRSSPQLALSTTTPLLERAPTEYVISSSQPSLRSFRSVDDFAVIFPHYLEVGGSDGEEIRDEERQLLQAEKMNSQLEMLKLKLKFESRKSEQLKKERTDSQRLLENREADLASELSENSRLKKVVEHRLEQETVEQANRRRQLEMDRQEHERNTAGARQRHVRISEPRTSSSSIFPAVVAPQRSSDSRTSEIGTNTVVQTAGSQNSQEEMDCKKKEEDERIAKEKAKRARLLALISPEHKMELERLREKLRQKQEAKEREEREKEERRRAEQEKFKRLREMKTDGDRREVEQLREKLRIRQAQKERDEKIALLQQKRSGNSDKILQGEMMRYMSIPHKGWNTAQKEAIHSEDAVVRPVTEPVTEEQEWVDVVEEVRLHELEKEILELEESKYSALVELRMLESERNSYRSMCPPPGITVKRARASELTEEYEEVKESEAYTNTDEFEYYVFVSDDEEQLVEETRRLAELEDEVDSYISSETSSESEDSEEHTAPGEVDLKTSTVAERQVDAHWERFEEDEMEWKSPEELAAAAEVRERLKEEAKMKQLERLACRQGRLLKEYERQREYVDQLLARRAEGEVQGGGSSASVTVPVSGEDRVGERPRVFDPFEVPEKEGGQLVEKTVATKSVEQEPVSKGVEQKPVEVEPSALVNASSSALEEETLSHFEPDRRRLRGAMLKPQEESDASSEESEESSTDRSENGDWEKLLA